MRLKSVIFYPLFLLIFLFKSFIFANPFPVVSSSDPGNQMMGESFSMSLCMDNSGDTTGYQPIYELIIPQGITFQSATYLGGSINYSIIGTCEDSNGCTFQDPDTGVDVNVEDNETFIILRYPLGSFTPDEPPQCMDVTFKLGSSDNVTLGVPEYIEVTPIFSLGADPLDNPSQDPPIYGNNKSYEVIPQVITLIKEIISPEKETATGPNYPREVKLTVNVANGETVNNLIINDTLPDSFQFLNVVNDGGCSVTQTPDINNPGGSIQFQCGDITGTTSSDEKSVIFRIYIPDNDSLNNPILDPNSPQHKEIENNATASVNYKNQTLSASDSDNITAKPIAIQKSVSIINDVDPQGLSPGDTLEYTLNIQVSDYFCLDNITIKDILGDGQRFDNNTIPTFSVNDSNTNLNGNFSLGTTYTKEDNQTSGLITLIFYLSEALKNSGDNGELNGDICFDSSFGNKSATAVIKFRAIVNDNYTGGKPGTQPLTLGDSIANNVTVSSNVVNGNKAADDDSGTSLTIAQPMIEKTIYAINGNTNLPQELLIAPNDNVTYRLKIHMHMASFENLTLKDYLPIPFFNATQVNGLYIGQAPPPPGSWMKGPDYNLNSSVSLTVNTNAGENTIEWDFGTYEGQDDNITIDILFTVTATDEPMADRLNLANLAIMTLNNSELSSHGQADVKLITTKEPELSIKKEIISTTNNQSQIGSDNTSLNNADAGDNVTFKITITNEGSFPAYDVKVKDRWFQDNIQGQGLKNCSIISVKDGNGNDISYSGDLFSDNLTLSSPIPADDDQVVEPNEQVNIIYNCIIDENYSPGDDIINIAQITNYAGVPNGQNFATNPDKNSSEVDINLAGILDVDKSIIDSSLNDTTPISNINQGEILTFQIKVELAEGKYKNFTLKDSSTSIPSPITCGSNGFTCDNVTINGNNVIVNGTEGSNHGVITYTYSSQETSSGSNTATAEADNSNSVSDSTHWYLDSPNLYINKSISPNPAQAGQNVNINLSWGNSDSNNPAFQCVIEDTLDGNIYDLNSVSLGTNPTGYTCSYDSNSGKIHCYTTDNSSPCPDGSLSITATILQDVLTGSSYENSATITGTSLPQGHQGDGDNNIEGEYSSNANANLNIQKASVVKSFIKTSENFTDPNDSNINNNPEVAVGEVATIEIHFTFPQGITKNVKIGDRLYKINGLAWGEYINGSAYLRKTSTNLSSTNNPGNINNAIVNDNVSVVLSVNDTSDYTELYINLDNVTNDDTDINTSEEYILSFKVVILNNQAANSGNTLEDRGFLSYTNANNFSQTIESDPKYLTVVEPFPKIEKTADHNSLQGGDNVTFTLTICNDNNTYGTTGFNWVFNDQIPDEFDEVSTPTVNLNGTGANVTASFNGDNITGTIDKLKKGECIDITYSAHLKETAQFGDTITNSAIVTTTSLPGNNGSANETPGNPGDYNGERTGNGNGVNDLYDTTSFTVNVATPNINKLINTPKNYYAIGEEPEFKITVGVPIGATDNFTITDTLPNGLPYVAGSLKVTLPNGMSFSNDNDNDGIAEESDSNFFTYDQNSNTLIFNFGNINVPNSGNIIIEYHCIVDNTLSNQDGTGLQNSVQLTYNDPNNPGQIVEFGPISTDVTVGEPNLEITKEITQGAVGSEAGDNVTWKITIINNGHTTAYNVNWSDILPDGLYHISNPQLNLSGNIYLNGTTTNISLSNVHIFTTNNDNDSIKLDSFQIPPGGSLSISFNSTIMDNVYQGETLNNHTVASYTSLVNGGRDNSSGTNVDDDNDTTLNNYQESADQTLTIAADIAIDKTVDKTQVTIGDIIKYTIKVDIIEGITQNVEVHDILPQGLTYVSHTITVGHMGIEFGNPNYNQRLGQGQEVYFNFGNISNPSNGVDTDDYFTIEIVARVDNIQSNQDGVVLKNGEGNDSPVYVQYGNNVRKYFDEDGNEPGNQGIPLTIVEPDLKIEKSVVPTTQSLGDFVTYTIKVSHTNNSHSDAYDIVVNDVLPDGLTFVECSLPTGSYTVNGQQLTFNKASLTRNEGAWEFTYKVKVDNDAVIDQVLENNAILTWKSLPNANGGSDSGRTGVDGQNGLNNYVDNSSASITPTSSSFIDALKVVEISNDADNSGDVTSGDTLKYTIVLHNTGDNVSGVYFYDMIPENTSYKPGSLTSTKGNIDDTQLPYLYVDIGDMNSGETVTITFEVIVDPYVTSGVVISNQGVVDSDYTVPEPTDSDGNDVNGDQSTDVVVSVPYNPKIIAQKTVELTGDNIQPTGTINVGDQITYTIILKNIGDVDLTNVDFEDDIPSQVTITNVTNANWSSQHISANFSSIPVSGSEIITVTGIVNSPGTVSNQGIVTSNELASQKYTDYDGDESNGDQPTTFVAVEEGVTGSPFIEATKVVKMIGDVNGDGYINPGEIYRYEILVKNNGSSIASDVRLNDTIPAGVSLINGSVTTSQGSIISENPLNINIGTLGTGDEALIKFDVRVNPGTPAGTLISNQATVTFNGSSVLSDDPSLDDGNDCSGNFINCDDSITGNDDPTDVRIYASSVFDPPMAIKTGKVNGYPLVEWRMVWINNGNENAELVRVIDPIPDGSTYVQGSLVCEPQGSSITNICEYDPVNNQIIWEGTIGADPGATNENNANNEVIIKFKTKFNKNVFVANNEAEAHWDVDGDGFIDDEVGQTAIKVSSSVTAPQSVPLLDNFGIILIIIGLGILELFVLLRRVKKTSF